MRSLKKIVTVAVLMTVALSAWAATDLEKEIQQRIAPVGDTCMSGDDCAAAPVAAAGGEPRSGEEVYKTKCFTCHASGAAGAPKYGNAGDWAARSAKGIDVLYTSALSGFQGMPAKGLCMDCSDDELKAAVDYILDNSK